MMRTLDARPFGMLGALLAGAALTLAVMAAAGSDPAVWVAVAGASACACGLVVGSTARVLPAAALAGVAATALVLAVSGSGEAAPRAEVWSYKAPAVVEPAPRSPRRRSRHPRRRLRRLNDPSSSGGSTPRSRTAASGRPGGGSGRPSGRGLRASRAWRAGYATTLSTHVEDLRIEADGNVRHVLVAVDRTPCGGTTERRYEVLWYLDRDGPTFTARDLDSVQLAGVDPALACG